MEYTIPCSSVEYTIPCSSVEYTIPCASVEYTIPCSSVECAIPCTPTKCITCTSVECKIPCTPTECKIPCTPTEIIPCKSVEYTIPCSSEESKISHTPAKCQTLHHTPEECKISYIPEEYQTPHRPMERKISRLAKRKTPHRLAEWKTSTTSTPMKPQILGSPAKHQIPGSPTKHQIPSSPMKPQIVSSLTKHQIPDSPTKHQIPGSPVKPQIGSSTKHQIPGSPVKPQIGSSTKHQIPGSPTKHQIPGSPTKHQIPGSPTKHQIPGSPTKHQIPGSPTKHQIPGSPTKHKTMETETKHLTPGTPAGHKTPVTPDRDRLRRMGFVGLCRSTPSPNKRDIRRTARKLRLAPKLEYDYSEPEISWGGSRSFMSSPDTSRDSRFDTSEPNINRTFYCIPPNDGEDEMIEEIEEIEKMGPDITKSGTHFSPGLTSSGIFQSPSLTESGTHFSPGLTSSGIFQTPSITGSTRTFHSAPRGTFFSPGEEAPEEYEDIEMMGPANESGSFFLPEDTWNLSTEDEEMDESVAHESVIRTRKEEIAKLNRKQKKRHEMVLERRYECRGPVKEPKSVEVRGARPAMLPALRMTNYEDGAPVFPYPKFATRNIIQYDGFVVCYDNQTRTVCWTMELVKPQEVEKVRWLAPEDRVETRVAADFQSGEADYELVSDRFKKQHAAEIDYHVNRADDDAKEACAFTNVFPQSVEGKSRDAKTMFDALHDYVVFISRYKFTSYIIILTGALYLPQQADDGSWSVKYELIGANKVAVPTHFYKVILAPNWDRGYRFECYKFENKLYEGEIDVKNFLVSRHDLEKDTGFLIFHRIKDQEISDKRECPKELDVYFL
uniref:DNA/RNA non-specific endonuclease domain-containing protein n=1 Tax=Strigamia maritima TaxID=126957 RepID=T1JEC6_STRMM